MMSNRELNTDSLADLRKVASNLPCRAFIQEIIPAPFEWSTNRRAKVHDLTTIKSKKIEKISGKVQCEICDAKYDLDLDLDAKFSEISTYIVEANNKSEMRGRAPQRWMNPKLFDCKTCSQTNCVKPVIADKKKEINWLFLLLSETLGCCSLEQLKYFCKHTKNYRSGAKDRVLYLTYLGLCKQLNPEGPFDSR